MKLTRKITFISISIMLLVVCICSAALIINAKNTIVQTTVAQGADKHDNLVRSFSNMIEYYSVSEMGDVTRRSVVKYCFSAIADNNSELRQNGETLYSQLSIDPSAYISAPQIQTDGEIVIVPNKIHNRIIIKVDGRDLLMLCSRVDNRIDTYIIYTVQDISGVYQSIYRMGLFFCVVCLTCILVGALLIALFMWRETRPLAMLGIAARRIAGGEYSGRAELKANDEVGILAQDFNSMADAVERHVRELTETAERQRVFIAGLTHEFKTPMTGVLIHSETLLNLNLNADEREHSLFYIHEQIRWLERLTQKLNLLLNCDLTIEIKPVSASTLVENVRQSVWYMLSQHNTPLEIECDDSVMNIDCDLMQSAVINLISNASKASSPGTAIELRVNNGVITVRDHGCGIPENELSRICEPFYMIDRSRSKKVGGSGLGLSLVVRIVEAHGAKLSFESELGVGTLVTITFC